MAERRPVLHFVDDEDGVVNLGYAELVVEKHCGRNWYRAYRNTDGWNYEPLSDALIPGLEAAKAAVREAA